MFGVTGDIRGHVEIAVESAMLDIVQKYSTRIVPSQRQGNEVPLVKAEVPWPNGYAVNGSQKRLEP
jgi:hypothetical protein